MHDSPPSKSNLAKHILWDLFCLSSIVGIWPRFIEPKLIFTKNLSLNIPHLPEALNGLKILQISDLHLNSDMSDSLLDKFIKKTKKFQPDLIVFTGDFLCYAIMDQPERLRHFLQQFKARYGCYAVFGNHDYSSFVSINSKGEYDTIAPTASSLGRAFRRIFETTHLTHTTTQQAREITIHQELVKLINDTPFQLLNNQTVTININDTRLNITGLGEYMLGKTDPTTAFSNYDKQAPGIILLHNPDGVSLLKDSPGDIVLSGHTHGGQVYLPWLWKKFTLLENMELSRGLVKYGNKWVYINRGMGSVLPFRWFSPPEILMLTLKQ